MTVKYNVLPADVAILRTLANRCSEIAGSPENLQRKARWLKHNALQTGEPMVICEVGGLQSNGEFPITALLECQEEWARNLELQFRSRIYQFDVMKDDWVAEPYVNCNWRVNAGDYGVRIEKHSGTAKGTMGSFVWEPPLKNLQDDFHKLKARQFSVDREASLEYKAMLDGVLGDVLPTRMRGSFWWTAGLTWAAIELVGLEQLMFYMVDDPEGLHRMMAFLRDDHLAFSEWLENEGLLSLNNADDYVGSGSVGYSDELPKPGMNGPVRRQDLWILSESQETVGVGPEMFAEFIFPYQHEITRKYSLTYYGCCEPLHTRWHIVRQMENLRKISVSPWCDQEAIAQSAGNRYVLCRKPNPAQVSTDVFDEKAIRADLRQTIDIARRYGCNLELVMKDVHTVRRQPQRLARWVEIAREEIAK